MASRKPTPAHDARNLQPRATSRGASLTAGPLFLITTAAGHRSRPPQPAIAAGHRGPGLTAYLALGS